MKKLNRTQQPNCLSKYSHSTNKWDDITSNDKALIWEKLNEMQGKFCAYCECYINKHNRHIEHFAKKSSYQDLTFCWENLFGSCNKSGNCGHYKDKKASTYILNELIKPDESDPEDYLEFTFSGKVQPKENLSKDELRKAEETIRVFNLNSDLLVQSRSNVINSLRGRFNSLNDAFKDPDIGDQDKLEFIIEELEKIKSDGNLLHLTAVKSVFLNKLVP